MNFDSYTDRVVGVAAALVNALTPGRARRAAGRCRRGAAAGARAPRCWAGGSPAPRRPSWPRSPGGCARSSLAAEDGAADRVAELVNALLADYRPGAAAVPARRRAVAPALHQRGRRGRTEWGAGCATGLAVVVDSQATGRLGVCRAEGCDRVYIDVSRNASRRFCSEACLNRTKVAAFRARARAATSAPPAGRSAAAARERRTGSVGRRPSCAAARPARTARLTASSGDPIRTSTRDGAQPARRSAAALGRAAPDDPQAERVARRTCGSSASSTRSGRAPSARRRPRSSSTAARGPQRDVGWSRNRSAATPAYAGRRRSPRRAEAHRARSQPAGRRAPAATPTAARERRAGPPSPLLDRRGTGVLRVRLAAPARPRRRARQVAARGPVHRPVLPNRSQPAPGAPAQSTRVDAEVARPGRPQALRAQAGVVLGGDRPWSPGDARQRRCRRYARGHGPSRRSAAGAV